MYQERMFGYYPQVIQAILEFKQIIDAEYPEFEDLSGGVQRVIDDAYLLTMSEDRVKQWEAILNIKPLDDSTVEDRRETIIARIRGQGKLNTELINSIVSVFTGGTAKSWVANSTLYVEIEPPPEDKRFRFENVEQELALKVPAHLNFQVNRNYHTWAEVIEPYPTWQDIKDGFDTWTEVLLYRPFE